MLAPVHICEQRFRDGCVVCTASRSIEHDRRVCFATRVLETTQNFEYATTNVKGACSKPDAAHVVLLDVILLLASALGFEFNLTSFYLIYMESMLVIEI